MRYRNRYAVAYGYGDGADVRKNILNYLILTKFIYL